LAERRNLRHKEDRRKERRIVDDELHKIAKDFVDEAEKHNAMIEVGNYQEKRQRKNRKLTRCHFTD